jgi:hypothetical protein
MLKYPLKDTGDIDVVIPWVDGSDPDWLKLFSKYKNEITSPLDNMLNRYAGVDTLKFVLRGIELYMPWVRYIYLVTNGQKPHWLRDGNSKIQIVFHEDIFINKKVLPVFNAISIAFNVHRIKGLAEKFIYFNDDFLVMKMTEESRFFVNSKPVDFFLQTIPRRGRLYEFLCRGRGDWPKIIDNTIECVNKKFSKKNIHNHNIFYSKKYPLWFRVLNKLYNISSRVHALGHYHHPQPYLKSHIEFCQKLYAKEIERTVCSKFRNENNVIDYLYRYTALVREEFYPSYFCDHSVCKIQDRKSLFKLEKMLSKMRFVCINDSINLSSTENQHIAEMLENILMKYFPDKSTFEN